MFNLLKCLPLFWILFLWFSEIFEPKSFRIGRPLWHQPLRDLNSYRKVNNNKILAEMLVAALPDVISLNASRHASKLIRNCQFWRKSCIAMVQREKSKHTVCDAVSNRFIHSFIWPLKAVQVKSLIRVLGHVPWAVISILPLGIQGSNLIALVKQFYRVFFRKNQTWIVAVLGEHADH